MNRGHLAVLVMFGLAICLGAVAVFVRYQQGDRALNYWGTQPAQLIRHAPRVELLWLGDGKDPATESEVIEQLTIDGRNCTVVRRKDISQARGLVHARHALITDRSYQFDEPRGNCEPRWNYVLRFSDSEQTAVLALDIGCSRARLVGTDCELSIAPAIGALEEFFKRQEDPEKPTKNSVDSK